MNTPIIVLNTEGKGEITHTAYVRLFPDQQSAQTYCDEMNKGQTPYEKNWSWAEIVKDGQRIEI